MATLALNDLKHFFNINSSSYSDVFFQEYSKINIAVKCTSPTKSAGNNPGSPHDSAEYNYSILCDWSLSIISYIFLSFSVCLMFTGGGEEILITWSMGQWNVFVFAVYLAFFLTHLMPPLISFDTPWKHQKTKGFLMLLGGIKTDQWHEMS